MTRKNRRGSFSLYLDKFIYARENTMQYDLFESPEICHVKQAVETLDSKCSRTHRRLFASHNELQKRTIVLEGMVEDLLQVIMTLQNVSEVKPQNDKVIVPMFGELMEMSK